MHGVAMRALLKRSLALCYMLVFWMTASIASAQTLAIESADPAQSVIWSKTLGEWRRIIVRLPESYSRSTQTYPVIYLLDGETHTALTAETVAFMASNVLMPEAIVVGIPNGVLSRSHNLTPPSSVAAEMKDAEGGASEFLSFIVDEVAPWIEQRHRTEPFRILIGHSYGGLFAMHTLLTRPDAFNAYLALDPSLWYDRQSFVTSVPAALHKLPPGRFRYLYTAGIVPNQALKTFDASLAASPPANIVLRTRPPRASEDHNSMVHLAIYDGLEQLFAGWSFNDVLTAAIEKKRDPYDAIQAHYQALFAKYGLHMKLPQKAYLWGGYQFIPTEQQPKRNPARAVQILSEMGEVYRDQKYLNLSAALAAAGRVDEALALLEEGAAYFSALPNKSFEHLTARARIKELQDARSKKKRAK
ncbi:alpha/beta hydrolase [Steroidobacter sp.]|uniref:alpha/beta hydrolase n=1 Tax=Steroidobacter sp. TaxID=1978227 RepID=UPI001A4ACB47|nr:alpha/beta hydrolase-fold protein [Steroidobacter sp.]MBL8265002.1 alpha/beta hydrolase [Steroidobacter sp.]